MKTTLDIPDPLLREARKVAERERTTLRALVEQGLRRVLADKQRRCGFRLCWRGDVTSERLRGRGRTPACATRSSTRGSGGTASLCTTTGRSARERRSEMRSKFRRRSSEPPITEREYPIQDGRPGTAD